jgi:2-dehydropantoate 2-reductase
MSGVAHFSSAVEGPGQVTHLSGNRLIIGDPKGGIDPTGGISDRVHRCAAALSAGPVRPEPSADIRRDIWEKLLGNVNLNPVSALTGATVLDILDDPDARQVCAAMFDETAAVGAALGIKSAMTADERLDIARELGGFRTSMLQDADRGRPLELDAIVGAVRELARRTGVPSPSLDAVHGLLALRERVRGHGESSAR